MAAPSTRHIEPLLPAAVAAAFTARPIVVVTGQAVATSRIVRFGWGIAPMSRLGRPVVVLAPVPPTQQQQTVFVWSVARPDRIKRQVTFPLQGWDGDRILGMGSNTTSSAGVFERFIGPEPPSVVIPLPNLRMMTISVTISRRTVEENRRHFPLQGWDGDSVQGLGPSTASRAGAVERFVGVDPPTIVKPLPTLLMQTITTKLAARSVALEWARRSVHYVIRKPIVILPYIQLPDRRLVTSVVLQAVARAVASQQRQPHWKLLPPQVLALPPPTFVATPIRVTLAGRTRAEAQRRDRQFTSYLAPPVVIAALTEGFGRLTTSLADQRSVRSRSASHYKLSPPATLEPESVALHERVISVTLAGRTRLEAQRRAPHSKLNPPATLEPATVALRERTIRVVLAGQTRVDLQRRASHFRLGAPQKILPLPTLQMQTVRVDLALHPRQGRGTHYHLAAPTVLATPVAAPVVTEVSVTLVAVRGRTEMVRREPFSKLSAPIFYAQTGRVSVTLAGRTRAEAQRRAPHFRLSPPATLEPEAVAIHERQITVVLAGRTRAEFQRRAPHSHLTYTSYPATSEITAALAGRTRLEAQRRASHYNLSEPTVVTPLPTRDQQTIRVTLAGRTRLEAQRRASHYDLAPPTKIRPLPTQQMETVAVWLAGRTRLEAQRRASHYRLSPPTVVIAIPSLRQQTITTELVAVRTVREQPRRFPWQGWDGDWIQGEGPSTTSRAGTFERFLGPEPPQIVLPLPSLQAQTIQTRLVAVRTATEQTRHAPHSRLFPGIVEPKLRLPDRRLRILTVLARIKPPPTKVRLSPPATLEPEAVQIAERTIRVVLAGRTRLEWGRHDVQARLAPPTVTRTLPNQQQTTITTWLAAVRTRTELVRHGPHSILAEPATLEPEAVALRERKITTSLAPHPRQPRAPHYRLSPPAVVRPAPSLRMQTITVELAVQSTRASQVRRQSHWFLRPPTVLAPRPTLSQSTIRVVLDAVRRATEQVRHFGRGRVAPPTTLAGHPVETTVKTYYRVAVETRADAARRAPHFRLEPPTKIRPITLVVWRLSPDGNWVLTAAAGNEWRFSTNSGWVLEPAAMNEWRVTAEPISGWTMGPDLP